MEVPPEFGGKTGTSVPHVQPEHLKAAFELYRKYSKMPPQDVAKGPDAIELGHTSVPVFHRLVIERPCV